MMETPKQEKVNNQSSKDIIIGLAISFWIMVNIVGFAAFGAEKIIEAIADTAINSPGYLLFSTLLIMFLLCSVVPFALLIMTAWLSSWFETGEKR